MRRPWVLITLGWALFGWLHATQIYLGILSEGITVEYSYGRFIAWQVGCWLLWAALTPIVVRLSRAVPLSRGNWRGLAVHALACIVLSLLRAAGMLVVTNMVRLWPVREAGLTQVYVGVLSSNFHLDLVVYWAIVGVVHAIDSRRRLRERELHASRVEAQLAQAQLSNLRLQLQPHFLFNTLHAIASLVRDGRSPAAVTMIAGLSDLLRYSLDNAGRNLVPLSEELEAVQRYLDIQQTRFPDRLAVKLSVDDEVRDAAVPTLLLQPLVENAIRHGIAPSLDGGRLEVSARRGAHDLVVEVFDDGPPVPDDWQSRQGVGLSATRGRLQQLYGTGGRLELENLAGGVVARVRIPFSKDLADA